jgi:hypothetical protein
MRSLSKYRYLSITVAVALALTWLLALAALWNSLLSSEVKKEGWVLFFMVLVLISGMFLFYLAYKSADEAGLESAKKQAWDAGRAEIVQEIEKKKKLESEKKIVESDLQKTVDTILAGTHGTRSENTYCNKLLTSLSREMGFVQAVIYVKKPKENIFVPVGSYALTERKPEPFKEGETLPGQAAANKTMSVLYDIPEKYFVVSSGLGSAQPKYLLLVPVIYKNESIAVLELAAFTKPDAATTNILDKILSEVGEKLNKFITA